MSYDPEKTVAENLHANGYRYEKLPHPDDAKFLHCRAIYRGDEFVGVYAAHNVLIELRIKK